MHIEEITNKIHSMSLEEKVGQLNQAGLWDFELLCEEVRKGRVGSVILADSATAGNDEQQRVIIDQLNELQRIAVEESPVHIPLIFGRDVIHGYRTVLPVPLAAAASFNPDIVEKAYRAVAREAANDGVHWTFSPMIDIARDPRWGRCIEGFGEDPYLTSKMGQAVIRGFQGEDNKKADSVAACAKHYLGYGAVEGGRDYNKAEISDYTLRNYYLKPFKAAVDAGTATVMNSFSEISGQPVASSRYLLHDILKDELGFKGFIISDWGSIEQLVYEGVAKDRKEAAALSANAELDMDMISKCYIDYMSELVAEGKVSEEIIDKMVYRILYIKEKFGLLNNPYITHRQINYSEHFEITKQCADETVTLLKNEGILPLNTSKRIALIGPFLHEKRSLLGSWTLDADIDMVQSVAEAFADRVPDKDTLIFSQGDYLWDDILSELHNVDTVLVVLGESAKVTGENNCLANIELPQEQLELAKKMKRLGKKVIGVLCFGRPIALEKAEPYFDAILYAWHSGTYAAQSIADIVYGKVNPSGKLPMSFPRATGQIPIYYNYHAMPRNGMGYYGEGSNYLDCRSTPMYPFGYGMSYTKFAYSEARCEKAALTLEELKNGKKFKVGVTVTNTGGYDGKETVQCYVRDLIATMARPVKELKGFSKIFLKRGEAKEVVFELGSEELGFYNGKGKFCVEPGEFDIFIGGDCTTRNKIKITAVAETEN